MSTFADAISGADVDVGGVDMHADADACGDADAEADVCGFGD